MLSTENRFNKIQPLLWTACCSYRQKEQRAEDRNHSLLPPCQKNWPREIELSCPTLEEVFGKNKKQIGNISIHFMGLPTLFLYHKLLFYFIFFCNQEAAKAQGSSGLLFLYVTLLLFLSTTGAFGFWGLWWACVLYTSPEWNTPLLPINQLCFFRKISRPQMHKYVSTHISADCFLLVQELLHILPYTWESSFVYFESIFRNQLCREILANLTERGANVSYKAYNGIFKCYRPKSQTFLPLLSLSLSKSMIKWWWLSFNLALHLLLQKAVHSSQSFFPPFSAGNKTENSWKSEVSKVQFLSLTSDFCSRLW